MNKRSDWNRYADSKLVIKRGRGDLYTPEEMWVTWSHRLAGKGFQFINARIPRGTHGISELPRKLMANYYPGQAGRLIHYMQAHGFNTLKYQHSTWTEIQITHARYYLNSLATGWKPPITLAELGVLHFRTEGAVTFQLKLMSQKRPTLTAGLPIEVEKEEAIPTPVEVLKMRLAIWSKIINAVKEI